MFRLSFISVILLVSEFIPAQNTAPKKSTASENVSIIDTAFYIPQLQRSRRIWIYLPEGYETSKKKFPVLYMHDGQNVFDAVTSFAGEWGVDEALDTLGLKTKECIVVGIDNGAAKRINEYLPYNHERFGKGEGNEYATFLAKTLKPFIDKKYRTLKSKQNTFLAGSSMGGLISLYALLKYPKVFGGAGVFSPSFWMAPSIYNDIRNKGKKVKSKIYFYAGMEEGGNEKDNQQMVTDMLKVFDAMHRVSKSKMTAVLRAEGRHNEASWRKEFPWFYEWLITK